MTRRRVKIGREGFGSSLDVITLKGLDGCSCGVGLLPREAKAKKHRMVPSEVSDMACRASEYEFAHRGKKGIWKDIYKKKKIPWPQMPVPTGTTCVSWKPKGKGCACKPVCASFSSRKAGESKKKVTAVCDKRCPSKKAAKRKR